MQFPLPTTITLLTLLTTASARITGISAPATITPGVPFTISLQTENYIQTVYDVSIAFGISTGAGYPGTLGAVFASEYLGPSMSNTIDTLNFTVSVDANTPTGDATINSALTSLYGASSSPVLAEFNATVSVVGAA